MKYLKTQTGIYIELIPLYRTAHSAAEADGHCRWEKLWDYFSTSMGLAWKPLNQGFIFCVRVSGCDRNPQNHDTLFQERNKSNEKKTNKNIHPKWFRMPFKISTKYTVNTSSEAQTQQSYNQTHVTRHTHDHKHPRMFIHTLKIQHSSRTPARTHARTPRASKTHTHTNSLYSLSAVTHMPHLLLTGSWALIDMRVTAKWTI